MKKYCWLIILGLIFACSLSAYAWNLKFFNRTSNTIKSSDLEIVPTMDSESNSKNTVWVGTFQLVWNDLVDEIIKNPIQFNEKLLMVDNLNKKSFTVEDLKEASYYKKLGLVSRDMKKEIEEGIKLKFNEKSDILDKFDWTPAPKKYILYAMLKKDFEYVKPFDKLSDGAFTGSTGFVHYFGIDKSSDSSLRYSVRVLFYNNNNDYAIALKSKSGDTVYLYRTNDDKTLADLYEDMTNKADRFMGIRSFGKKDEFKAPMIDFKTEKNFQELCNKPIKNTDFVISKAIETIQFKMNETGVKLKSEAGIMVGLTCAPSFNEQPRYFYFNNKYVIFLQEKNKPYFAMKVEDAKALQ